VIFSFVFQIHYGAKSDVPTHASSNKRVSTMALSFFSPQIKRDDGTKIFVVFNASAVNEYRRRLVLFLFVVSFVSRRRFTLVYCRRHPKIYYTLSHRKIYF
jgi:hypothetical protein